MKYPNPSCHCNDKTRMKIQKKLLPWIRHTVALKRCPHLSQQTSVGPERCAVSGTDGGRHLDSGHSQGPSRFDSSQCCSKITSLGITWALTFQHRSLAWPQNWHLTIGHTSGLWSLWGGGSQRPNLEIFLRGTKACLLLVSIWHVKHDTFNDSKTFLGMDVEPEKCPDCFDSCIPCLDRSICHTMSQLKFVQPFVANFAAICASLSGKAVFLGHQAFLEGEHFRYSSFQTKVRSVSRSLRSWK